MCVKCETCSVCVYALYRGTWWSDASTFLALVSESQAEIVLTLPCGNFICLISCKAPGRRHPTRLGYGVKQKNLRHNWIWAVAWSSSLYFVCRCFVVRSKDLTQDWCPLNAKSCRSSSSTTVRICDKDVPLDVFTSTPDNVFRILVFL